MCHVYKNGVTLDGYGLQCLAFRVDSGDPSYVIMGRLYREEVNYMTSPRRRLTRQRRHPSASTSLEISGRTNR